MVQNVPMNPYFDIHQKLNFAKYVTYDLIAFSRGNDISDFSICNGKMKNHIGTSTFYTKFLRSSSSLFLLTLLTVDVQNTICNSLITIPKASWRNLNKIG